uniref:interleukin-1 receptor-associated kinase 3-like n=1 Tax=Oncorhynchus gorbuscha TaxID=8017 RepID=UPI001EAF22A6
LHCSNRCLLYVPCCVCFHHHILFSQPPPPVSESTRPGWNQSNDHVSSEGRNHRLVITYSDVVEGTRHFHQDMKISEGSFSAVYRAVKGNETFAVKLFKQVQKASWRKLWDLFRERWFIICMSNYSINPPF